MPPTQRTPTSIHRLLARRLSVLCVGTALAAAGCFLSTGDRPSARSPESPGRNDTEVANYAVVSTYQQFWIILGLLDDQPVTRWPGILGAVATDPELSRQLAAARERRDDGVRHTGEPMIHISMVQGALTTTATLTDCQDTTTVTEVDSAGAVRHTGGPHTPVAATLTRATPYGTWRVADISRVAGTC